MFESVENVFFNLLLTVYLIFTETDQNSATSQGLIHAPFL